MKFCKCTGKSAIDVCLKNNSETLRLKLEQKQIVAKFEQRFEKPLWCCSGDRISNKNSFNDHGIIKQ